MRIEQLGENTVIVHDEIPEADKQQRREIMTCYAQDAIGMQISDCEHCEDRELCNKINQRGEDGR